MGATGASRRHGRGGYVGSRLVPALLAAGPRGHRDLHRATSAEPLLVVRPGRRGRDGRPRPAPRCAPPREGADALYYLVHGLGGDDFATSDRQGAYNAAHAAVRAGVERIVYLGGLVPDIADGDLSPHLRSRLEVEQVLTDSGVPTLALRAAMVIGSGSTSFEIMRQMSERMPVQVLPTLDGQPGRAGGGHRRGHRPGRRADSARAQPRLRRRQRGADGVCRAAAALRGPSPDCAGSR